MPDHAFNEVFAELKSIFGPKGDDIISSGDAVSDRSERERFVAAYEARHSFQSDLTGGMTLVVGEQDRSGTCRA